MALQDGFRDGKGELTCPSGIKFVGQFKVNDVVEGEGKYQGSYYIGNWKNNRIEGAGMLQLKGEDEVPDWHTQRFTRKDLLVFVCKHHKLHQEEIRNEKEDRTQYLRELTRPLGKLCYNRMLRRLRS